MSELLTGVVQSPDETRKRVVGNKFVLTVAQNNTAVHKPFWEALQNYCIRNQATLMVAQLSYNKKGWQKITTEAEGLWYDPVLEPYIVKEQVKIAKDLVFCAELDILPTARMPLTGLDAYTGHNSGIVPHTKMQMQSYASMKGTPARFMYTTGACTLRNYIDRRAGQLASYHHVYGALVVEVDDAGDWFVRQLNASDDGSFYDLDTMYTEKGTSYNGANTCIRLGDIHVEKLDRDAFAASLDMIATLKPRDVVLDDLIDFTARNHHSIRSPLHYAQIKDHNIKKCFKQAAQLIYDIHNIAWNRSKSMHKPNIYVVNSNHDDAYGKWLQTRHLDIDHVNQIAWHEGNVQLLKNARKKDFSIFEWAMQKYGGWKAKAIASDKTNNWYGALRYLRPDESLVLNGIENGLHGHLGLNGARGNPKAYRQLGCRVNSMHTHSAGIVDGVYTGGTNSLLDLGYNKGPSSWSHSDIITYPNGKRTIITKRGVKWRA